MKQTSKKVNVLDFLIVILYLVTVFVPSLGAFDFAATQWLYIGILNTLVFIYYTVNSDYINFYWSKYIKLFFGIQLATFIVSCLSMTQSLIIDESIIYISRILTFMVSVFNLYVVFRRNNGIGFYGLSLLISIILFIESFEVVYYFTSKYNALRTNELLSEIPHKYGNRNILATAIVIKLPFLLYLFQQLKGLKKLIALFGILLVIISILLIGARTAALIMGVILVVFSISYYILAKYSIKQSAATILPLIIAAVMAYGYSISINKIYSDKLNSYVELFFTKSEKDLYNPKESIDLIQGSGRENIWASAITDFKKSPIIGVGIGNWRHNSKEDLLKGNRRDVVTFYTHVHNDYLQSLAETGILGFLLYISVFILSIVLLFKHFVSLKTTTEKLFIITIAIALLGYMLDAFYNFPHHRAPIQIVFAFILALILGVSNNEAEHGKKLENSKLLKIFAPISIIILLLNLVNHYRDYSGSKVQYKMMVEVKNKDAFTSKYKYSYDQVNNMLPNFPYVNQIGMTNDDIKGMFAINNKRYDKAHAHLDKSIISVENNMWPKTLKAMLFNARKNEDSAYSYSKEVFDIAPSVESNFYILRDIYKRRNDTTKLFNLYDRHLKVRPNNISGWLGMCNDIRRYYRDDSLALKKVNLALKSYPFDKELLNFKDELIKIISSPKSKSDIIASKLDKSVIDKMTVHFQNGNSFFDKKDYKNARTQFLKVLELEPNNLPTHFKLGILENLDANYKAAIPYFTKAIEDKYLDNGRPEYGRGYSYFKLNDLNNAKKDFLISRKKGWPAALKLNDAFFE